MSETHLNETITTAAASRWRRRISEITCVVGAIGGVALGTILFGGAPATMPLLATLFAWIWSAVLTTASACTIVLVHAPWTAVFDVFACICIYCLCRVVRARARRRAYLVTLAALVVAWVLYACVQPAGSDLQLKCLKAFAIGLALAAPGAWWYLSAQCDSHGTPVPPSRHAISRSEDYAWIGLVVLTVIAFIVTGVMGFAHLLDSTNTMPDVTEQVQAKYGAELERLGFEDVNREDFADDNNNSCSTINVVFHDGAQVGVTPPPVADVFMHFEGSAYSDPKPACVGMRFREGKLTMAIPSVVADTRREDAVKAALDGADQMMVQIRKAHDAVVARTAVSATWQTTASR